jgi:hypothetical protein
MGHNVLMKSDNRILNAGNGFAQVIRAEERAFYAGNFTAEAREAAQRRMAAEFSLKPARRWIIARLAS